MTQWLKEIKKKFGVHVIKFKIASTTLQKPEKSTHDVLRSENESVDGKGLQPVGDIFYAPSWFLWRGRENEPPFEVKLRLGLRRSNVRGEQLTQVDEIASNDSAHQLSQDG